MPRLTAPTEDAVRTRAYLLWEADGGPFGQDEHYWNLAFAALSTPNKPARAATKPIGKAAKPKKK